MLACNEILFVFRKTLRKMESIARLKPKQCFWTSFSKTLAIRNMVLLFG